MSVAAPLAVLLVFSWLEYRFTRAVREVPPGDSGGWRSARQFIVPVAIVVVPLALLVLLLVTKPVSGPPRPVLLVALLTATLGFWGAVAVATEAGSRRRASAAITVSILFLVAVAFVYGG